MLCCVLWRDVGGVRRRKIIINDVLRPRGNVDAEAKKTQGKGTSKKGTTLYIFNWCVLRGCVGRRSETLISDHPTGLCRPQGKSSLVTCCVLRMNVGRGSEKRSGQGTSQG